MRNASHTRAAAMRSDIDMARAYVASRVVHSLVQVLVNFITLRFVVFSVSSLILFVLAGQAAMQVF